MDGDLCTRIDEFPHVKNPLLHLFDLNNNM